METEGPIADDTAPLDMSRRIEILTKHLGINKLYPPLDTTDFIAAHLRPNSVVYIEDPFGKTDDEFFYSMHTYRFFDLDEFVKSISDNSARNNCHILLTSRESLFERWINECKEKVINTPLFILKNINKTSYEFNQKFALAEYLIKSKNVIDIKKSAQAIAQKAELPFDIELIIRDLPSNATNEEVSKGLEKFQGEYINKARNRIAADTDSERLFLLLLIVLRQQHDKEGNNFHVAFKKLHYVLNIGDNADESLFLAMVRYRAFYYRSEAFVTSGTGRGVSFDKRNDESAFHLEPVHSTVVDAISDYLQNTASEWLELVAMSLHIRLTGNSSRIAQKRIAAFLIKRGISNFTEDACNGLKAALFRFDGYFHFDVSEVLNLWNILPPDFKEEFFKLLENSQSKFLSFSDLSFEMSYRKIPASDMWRFLEILINKPAMGVNLFNLFSRHPWDYLGQNLKFVPTTLKEKLDKIAKDKPSLFVYALSEIFVGRWDEIPANWRIPFSDPVALSSEDAQGKLLTSIVRDWNEVGSELKKLFRQQIQHENFGIRARAGTAALVYYETAPKEMEEFLKTILEDKDIYVPLYVMQQGLGKDEQDKRFAQTLYEKVEDFSAAIMLDNLISKDLREIEWKNELANLCITKGADFASGVLTFYCLNQKSTEFLGFKLPEIPENQPEPVQFAWVINYINSKGKVLPFDRVISLINNLSYSFKYWILFNLSVQAFFLEQALDDYLQKLDLSEDLLKAVKEGEKDRNQIGESREFYGVATFYLPIKGLKADIRSSFVEISVPMEVDN